MMPVRGAVSTQSYMIGLKRFIHPALVVSVIGHVGPLILALLFVGAHPSESTPPDAMVVDIVPPNEAPRFEGTPSELRSSGSQTSSKSTSASAAAQPPPHPPAKPAPQQPQQGSNPQRDASQAPAQPHSAQPETAHAEMVHAETAQPEAQQPEAPKPEAQNQSSEPQPEQTPDQPGAAEMVAQLALVGGPLGGGFAAPPIDTSQADYDFTAAFREYVSSCSVLPAGMNAGDNVSIRLRIFFNRDGSLASPPQLREPNASPKQQALMQSATDALQKCQPFSMLPPKKYKQWKTLDFVVSPMSFLGR
jgi:hypothetical protein